MSQGGVAVAAGAPATPTTLGPWRPSGLSTTPTRQQSPGRASVAPSSVASQLLSQQGQWAAGDGSDGAVDVAALAEPKALYRCSAAFVVRVILSSKFDGLIGCVVVLNSVTMALESEVAESWNSVLEALDVAFLTVFTVELLLRAFALRWLLLRSCSNILDAIIVIAGWIQVVLQSVSSHDDDTLKSFQALKVFRALRALRMLRMVVFFDGLWLSVTSFFAALWPLLWTCTFISIILLIGSQFAVHLVGTDDAFDGLCLDYGDGCKPAPDLYGGTVSSTVTLFQIMTLDDWRAVVQPICDRRWLAYFFFAFYIGISGLLLMNLVTAVVVENTIKRTLSNEEFQQLRRVQELDEGRAQVRQLLEAVCDDEELLDPGALLQHQDGWTPLGTVFNTLGLRSEEELLGLMSLMGLDDDIPLTVVSFLDLCLKLHDDAGDKVRMALYEVAAESGDWRGSLERLLDKRYCWMRNAASAGRLVQRALDHGGRAECDADVAQAAAAAPRPQQLRSTAAHGTFEASASVLLLDSPGSTSRLPVQQGAGQVSDAELLAEVRALRQETQLLTETVAAHSSRLGQLRSGVLGAGCGDGVVAGPGAGGAFGSAVRGRWRRAVSAPPPPQRRPMAAMLRAYSGGRCCPMNSSMRGSCGRSASV